MESRHTSESPDTNQIFPVTSNLTPIQEFYKNSVIFLTGCTGFLGHILLEKLLRSCPGISKIFLLIRKKKEKDIQSRLEEIFSSVTFEKLRKQDPHFSKKVMAIAGDCTLPELGISAEDRQIVIDQVTIVFHLAATVRFDEKLKLAVEININGTQHCLLLAQKMTKLKAMVHVSTIFTNCLSNVIKEEILPPAMDYKLLQKLSKNLSGKQLDKITPILLDKYPNTYIFTKQITEDLVKKLGTGLPVGIFRPPVIISTYKEPIKGWTNNIYGPISAVASSYCGLLRVSLTSAHKNANAIPGDMCSNAIIAAAWDISTNFHKNGAVSEMPVYNYESRDYKPLTWNAFKIALDTNLRKLPSVKSFWYPKLILTNKRPVYYILAFILHTIPAFLIDVTLVIRGKPPKMLKLYKKVHYMVDIIIYFANHAWYYSDKRMQGILNKMSLEERKIFFCDVKEIDWNEYFESFISGIRQYVLQDPLSTLDDAKVKLKKLYWFHQLAQIPLVCVILWLCWTLLSFFN